VLRYHRANETIRDPSWVDFRGNALLPCCLQGTDVLMLRMPTWFNDMDRWGWRWGESSVRMLKRQCLKVCPTFISCLILKTLTLDEHPHFLKYASDLAGALRHTIFVDQVSVYISGHHTAFTHCCPRSFILIQGKERSFSFLKNISLRTLLRYLAAFSEASSASPAI